MNRNDLYEAASVLRRGGIVAYPTEACYGLGCDPRNHAAIRRLLAVKRRSWSHGLILIAESLDRLLPYLAPVPPQACERARATWPGPHTWLWPAQAGVSRWLRGGHDSLAVRVTAHPGAAALCRHARLPLVSTSANRHGRRPARSAEESRRLFGNDIDYFLAGKLGGAEKPTEIRDVVSGAVVRPA